MSKALTDSTKRLLQKETYPHLEQVLRDMLRLRAAHLEITQAALAGENYGGVAVCLDLMTSIDYAILKLTERFLTNGHSSATAGK